MTKTDNEHERPSALLRRGDVEAMTGLRTSSLYGLIADGKFPRPVHIGAHSVAWRECEVLDWIDSLSAKKDGVQ